MAYAEVMRLVHLSPGGRPIVDLDLLAEAVYSRERNSLEIVPATEDVRSVSLPGRFGGTRAAGSAQANGQINWRTGVEGATHDQALANAGALVARVKETAPGRLLELKLGSATRPGYYDLRGPGAWTPTYRQSVFQRKRFWIFDVSLPVGPLVSRLPMDIHDDFAPMADTGELARNLVPNPNPLPGGQSAPWVAADGRYLTAGANLSTAGPAGAVGEPNGRWYFVAICPGTAAGEGMQVPLVAPSGGWVTGATYKARLAVHPLDGTGALEVFLGTVDAFLNEFTQVNTTPLGWTTVELTFTPANSKALCVALRTASAQARQFAVAVVRVDRVVSPAAPLGVYFDGDATDGAAWLGAPHASASVLYARSPSADYTLLAGTGIAVSGGALRPTAITQKRIAQTGRGYRYGDVQVTSEVVFATTVANYEGPPAAKILDAGNAIWATYESSNVAIYKTDGGSHTRLALVGITVPSAASRRWIRLRIEGNLLTAEWWTTAPTPMGAPAQTVSATLAGGDATKFGAGVEGQAGIWFWEPHSSLTSYVDSLTIEPYTYRNRGLPDKIALGGAVPGSAPAIADVDITPAGGAAPPVFCALGFTARPRAPLAGAAVPFGQIEAEAATDLAGWVVGADAASRSGSHLTVTANGPGAASAMWTVDASTLDPEPYTDDLLVEVWAHVLLASGVTSPRLALSTRPADGLNFGAERFSEDFPAAGALVVSPSSGTRRRPVRLGRIRLDSDRDRPTPVKLRVAATWAGGAGQFALDWLDLLPARTRLASPTGLANGPGYPAFVASTAETLRTLHADGSGSIAKPPGNPSRHHGLGRPIELGLGNVDLTAVLSGLVPDDPTVGAASEQVSHPATVHVRVTPRDYLPAG